jgi:dTDP-glucose 4,6-dehydratase
LLGEPDPSFWKGKTVFVTGASGFAGGHLAEQLYKLGANVRCFVRSEHSVPIHNGGRVNLVLGDVQDYQSLIEGLKGADVAFHLAAITVIPETRAKIFNTFTTNSLGTLNFLMAAREAKLKKVVYVSTCHVYGKQDNVPLTEDTPPHPIDIYSASKLAGESVALSFAEMYNMDISISRAFNHYGPRQRPDFLIPQVIFKLMRSKGAPIQMGNPEPTRDFTYVDDIVRGYLLLAEKGQTSSIYHFSSGIERTVKDIVDTVVRLNGAKTLVKWDPGARRVDIPRSVGDYSKAKKELGWMPRTDFDEGIKRTLSWYRTHPDLEEEIAG